MSTSDPIQVAEIEAPPNRRVNDPPRSRVWQVAFRCLGPRDGSAPNRPDERHSVCPWVQTGRWCHGWDTEARERTCVGVRNCLRIGQGRGTRSRAFCVIGPPVRALEETSRQLAWLALASGAADPGRRNLRAISGEPDWFDLWKALEILNGGQHVFPSWPRDEAEWLGASAARYHHSPSHRQWRKGPRWLQDNGKPKWNWRMRRSLEDARRLAAVWLAQLSQLAVNNPSNGRISEGVVAQGRHHRVDGHCVSECRPL